MPEPQPDPSPTGGPRLLRPRRELFEHGLLSLPKLIFADGALTLAPLKATLPARVDAQALADALLIPLDHALLALETLAAVLPADRGDADPSSADAHDVVLFLYVQSYKRLVPRGGHKDSPAVADVWPSNSAFDGYLSAMSPLQLARSNSRRFMPSQVDEEAHQLSYLQKHMANILSLLAEPEGGNDESLVLTPERFQHLELLIQFAEKGFEGVPLSHAVPLFENSDPVKPAVPVPAAQVLDWVLQTIASSLEHILEKATTKENGTVNSSDMDVMATDACTSTRAQTSSSLSGTSIHNSATYCRSQTFVEGISKASVVKQACNISGHSVKVLNCHDSVIYILAPLRYATVYGCSDVTVVLGAIGKAVRVEHCERVQVITAAKRICIANCRECVFFLGVNQQPLILGDNHKLQVAPYNTFYPQLEEHMAQVGIDATINRWDKPLVVGMVDPHDSLSHPAGVSDVQAESATCLDADQFTNFMIPKWFGVESTESTKHNPFPLPDNYIASQTKNHSLLIDIQQVIRNAQLEDSRKREVACALHVHFKDWLYASGNIRQLYCLQE